MTLMDRRNNTIAGFGTVIVWLLLILIFSAFGKFSHKPVYKTVKIQLESASTPKIAEKVEAAPPKADVAAPAPSAPPPPAPAAPAAKQPAKAKEQPKAPAKQPAKNPPPPKTAAKPASKPAPQPQKLQKSVDEQLAEMSKSKAKPKKEFDWSQFDDDATETSSSSSSTAVTSAKTVDALSGTAASSSKGTSSSAVTSKSSSKSTSTAASSATSAALGSIAASNYSTVAGNGVTSTSSVKTASAPDGKIAMYMSDGSSRILLEPAKPVIALSDAAAATISVSIDLNITFVIDKNGRVSVNSISIPKAMASQIVRDEIARQIATWRFDAATYESTAVFTHKIIKK